MSPREGFRNRKQSMPCRAINGSIRVMQEAERVRGAHGQEPLCSLCRKEWMRQMSKLRVA